MAPLTLQQLSNVTSATKIADGGILPDNAIETVKALLKQQLAKKFKLDELNIVTKDNYNNANYNYNTNTLTTGLTDPDVIAHEGGHIQNLQNAPIYQKLLTAAKGIVELNGISAIPIMLALRAFAPEDKRQDILQSLAGLSSAAAGTNLMEEASASTNAILNSDDKLRTAGKLLPAFGQHALANIIPVLLYQLDRHL